MESNSRDEINRPTKERKLSNGKCEGNDTDVSNSKTSAEESSKKMTSKDYYFDSYSHFGIHEEMIKDDVRTQSYLNVIEANKQLIEGKIVLDVGCGTGILSMFCARAGAAKVIAIECSAIAKQAEQIISANKMSDVITVVHAKCEDLTELPHQIEQVDIIISEWMGYFLLYESMLDTVIYCRNRWLKPGGLMLPDRAVLKLAAMEDEQYRHEKIDFWDSVYGFDMQVIKEIALLEPLVDIVDNRAVLSDSVAILDIDLRTCTKADLSFSTNFKLNFTRDDTVHGLVSYFNCLFSHVPLPQFFSTGPGSAYTHWKQTIFYLKSPVRVVKGESVVGKISVAPNSENQRDLDISVDMNFPNSAQGDVTMKQEYRLR